MNANKLGGTNEELEAALDERNKQAGQRFKALFGGAPVSTGDSASADIPQTAGRTFEPNLKPRAATLSEKPLADDGGKLAHVLNNVAEATKRNQLKELQDLEDVGAFEAPDSEVNKRAALLRGLLGQK